MPAQVPEKQNTLYVGSLAKGLRILRAFDETATELSLSELVKRTGLEKSAAQRLANTLHLEGMLDKDPATKRYRPSHAWLEMAYAYFWSNPLVRLAMPKLIELSHQLDATVNLAEMSGDHILYVSRVPGRSGQFASTIVGRRLPALSSAAGRAVLSTLPKETRDKMIATWPLPQMTPRTNMDRDSIVKIVDEAEANGFAMTQDQSILSQTGIAAPIKGPNGQAFAAIQCSVSTRMWSIEKIEQEILPYIIEAADSIAPHIRG
ncbi:IclR family transcriptional regulator [Pseudophaeobacter arcticus]|uniref:IclR family transcriptional regulator n=1 Tax=Pseudophaeobacter arcticus TaxID=385492 RepID=UPI00248F49E1|nr:IclR family transcriptional regulator [Pseudophaeobacter arcticus]